jgi:hypothetical protein
MQRRKKVPKQRLAFDFSEKAANGLYDLMEDTGAKSLGEVISKALRIYEWVAGAIDPEDTINIISEEGEQKFSFKAKIILP